MAPSRRYCIVTSAHVSNNPRVVKEADALHAAGAAVRVVALATREELVRADRELIAHRGWHLTHVDGIRGGDRPARWAARAIEQRAAEVAFRNGIHAGWLADRAACRMLVELSRAARAEPADVIIGHNLEALPAAGHAALKCGAKLGFDAEDLHAEERTSGVGDSERRLLATAVERNWLHRCDYVTASSSGIAAELAHRYDIPRPHVVLNTFPRQMRNVRAATVDRQSARPTLYWYSQRIGSDRGIDEALVAISGLSLPVELHLRGTPEPGYLEHLRNAAREAGLADRLVVHPPEPAEQMVALAKEHDVGLAAEQPVSINRMLCATNKLFTYLLAGIAVAATDTPGQRAILDACPDAGVLYPYNDVDALRATLWSLLASPTRLARAKQAALDAALAQYSWEHEAPSLVAYLGGFRGATGVAARD